MLSLNIIAAASAALSLVSAAPIKVQERGVPKGWAHSYLEDYDVYHLRYLALSCEKQHNTTFFDDCCHPLLANETLASREDYCTPNSTEIASASSAIAYSATVSVTATATSTAVSEEESAYCSEEESVASAVSSAVLAATGTVSEVVITSAEATQTIAVVAQVQQAEETSASTSSTEEWVAPTTTSSTYVAPTTTSTTPAAATTTASSGGSVNTGGYATYFYQNGNPGACGNYNADSVALVAIDSAGWWPDYASGASSSLCGRSLTITNTNNGKSVVATVQDVCPTCTNDNSLDLSVGAFTAIASESDGMVPIVWSWN